MNIKMNIKPKKYIDEEGNIITVNKNTIPYNGELLNTALLLTYYNDNDEVIKKERVNIEDKLDILYLCLLNKAAYCSITKIWEVESES